MEVLGSIYATRPDELIRKLYHISFVQMVETIRWPCRERAESSICIALFELEIDLDKILARYQVRTAKNLSPSIQRQWSYTDDSH